MSFFSSITSAVSNLNPMSLASKAAESVCDALLPKQLEFIGDIVSLGIDFKSGNWAKCLDDLGDLTKDLPQQLAALNSKGAQLGLPVESWLAKAAEPDAPSRYGSHRPSPRRGFDFRPDWAFAPAQRGAPPAAPSPSSTNSSSTASGSSSSSTSTPAAATSGTSSSTSTNAASGKADDFFSMSNADLIQAVKSGNIPKEISDDPKKMQQLQMRMNDYTQMNQMITQMINALHEMNKQIIQNLRV